MNRTRSTILSILILVLISSVHWSCQDEKAESKPNIVLFFVDDLGWSDLGFRNRIFESPNIDKLAKMGLNFEQAYIATPTCSPSRATLLTGQHPARLQMVRHIPGGKKYGFDEFDRASKEFHYLERDPAQFPSRNWLPLENITYAEALKELGYYSAFIGKWHLGAEEYHPIHQGFDRQIGTSNYGHPKSYYPPYFRYDSIFADNNDRYLTDKLTDEAVHFIDAYEEDSPFMLTFSYYSVHSPHIGRKDLVEHFSSKGLEGKFLNYAAMLKATDESVGRVMDALTEKGIADNTILIFLSDQGGFFSNEPLRGGKMQETLFEGGARVPFFFYWPGVTTSQKVSAVVQSTDLFSTLVALAGGEPSAYDHLDGISLLPLISGAEQLTPRTIFGYRAYEDLYVSARKGDWKLLAYRSGKKELFNIADDMSETTDMASEKPDIVKDLVADIIQWEKEIDVAAYSGLQ